MLERYGHGGDLLSARELYGSPENGFTDFSSNMNPLGPPLSVKELCGEFWRHITGYPDPAVRELRSKLAFRYGIPEESILVGNGAAELIDLAIRVLKPRVTALARPSFVEYEEAVHKAGGTILDIPLLASHDFELQNEDLEKAAHQADAVFLGSPNNPTGRLVDPALLRPLIGRKETQVIVDEAFMDFVPEEDRFTLIREAPESRDLLVIRSMTKFYAVPGIRLGFIVGHPERIAELRKLQVPWSVNGLAQSIGSAVLDEEEYAERTKRVVIEERTRLSESLIRLGLTVFPSVTNYLLFALPEGCGFTVKELQSRLGRKGVLVRDASLFQGLTPAYCRIAVKGREDNDRLVRELKECLQTES